MSYKHPDVEDRQYCESGQHMWIKPENRDYLICYTCKEKKELEK